MYYGPLNDVNVLGQGQNYDVLNPPLVEIESKFGTGAKIQPVLSGSVSQIQIDAENYNVDRVVSIGISGGNGSGAVFKPIIIKKRKESLFDSRIISVGGGVDSANNRILFQNDHEFENFEFEFILLHHNMVING